MKKKRRIVLLIFGVLVVFVLNFGAVFPSFGIDIEKVELQSKSIPIEREVFFRQTYNNCAPYSAMAVINVLQHKRVNPEKLVAETIWRTKTKLTLPQGLISLLNKYGIETHSYTLYLHKTQEKIDWLKNQISTDKVVILLIGIKNVEHYVTVIGYDENGFMLYDSLQNKSKANPRMTVVDKPNYTGNRYYSDTELIKLWNDGNVSIFFENWALVCE